MLFLPFTLTFACIWVCSLRHKKELRKENVFRKFWLKFWSVIFSVVHLWHNSVQTNSGFVRFPSPLVRVPHGQEPQTNRQALSGRYWTLVIGCSHGNDRPNLWRQAVKLLPVQTEVALESLAIQVQLLHQSVKFAKLLTPLEDFVHPRTASSQIQQGNTKYNYLPIIHIDNNTQLSLSAAIYTTCFCSRTRQHSFAH